MYHECCNLWYRSVRLTPPSRYAPHHPPPRPGIAAQWSLPHRHFVTKGTFVTLGTIVPNIHGHLQATPLLHRVHPSSGYVIPFLHGRIPSCLPWDGCLVRITPDRSFAGLRVPPTVPSQKKINDNRDPRRRRSPGWPNARRGETIRHKRGCPPLFSWNAKRPCGGRAQPSAARIKRKRKHFHKELFLLYTFQRHHTHRPSFLPAL